VSGDRGRSPRVAPKPRNSNKPIALCDVTLSSAVTSVRQRHHMATTPYNNKNKKKVIEKISEKQHICSLLSRNHTMAHILNPLLLIKVPLKVAYKPSDWL